MRTTFRGDRREAVVGPEMWAAVLLRVCDRENLQSLTWESQSSSSEVVIRPAALEPAFLVGISTRCRQGLTDGDARISCSLAWVQAKDPPLEDLRRCRADTLVFISERHSEIRPTLLPTHKFRSFALLVQRSSCLHYQGKEEHHVPFEINHR